MKSKFVLTACVLITASVIFTYAGGLTAIGEIVVSNLDIGKTHLISKVSNTLFRVTNKSDKSVNIRIYPEPAQEDNLKPGCEVIPDISWINVEKKLSKAGPGRTIETDLQISIPDDKSYYGKKYQFYIVSETVPEGTGILYGMGLKSRVIFSIQSSPGKLKRIKGSFLKRFFKKIIFWK